MKRDISLDTLRGLTILVMVLSGTVAFGGNLPVWLYHEQAVSTNQAFAPNIPGISWKDLIFPFFLFSMGAAIPLSLHNKIVAGYSKMRLIADLLVRTVLLLFLAIFLEHVKPLSISAHPGREQWLIGIAGFVLLFFIYYQPKDKNKWVYWLKQACAVGLSLLLMFIIHFEDGSGVDVYRSDILIILIANNAFFGAIIWFFTRKNPLYRLAVLPFLFAILIAGDLTGSWNKAVLDATPIPWMYHFDYLGYLFVIIPGTFAGEFILAHREDYAQLDTALIVNPEDFYQKIGVMLSCMVLLVINVIFLRIRFILINLLCTFFIFSMSLIIWNAINFPWKSYYRKFLSMGAYLLALGLFLEAYQGGIKRGYSTFSYFFVSSGLACFMLLAIIICYDLDIFKRVLVFLSLIGKNPMVAYVGANLLVIPAYHLLGIAGFMENANPPEWIYLVKGLATAGIVALITITFTRLRLYWKV